MAPDTGVVENGVVTLHPGFMEGGNVLGRVPMGDFTAPGYDTIKVEVSFVLVDDRRLRGSN